MSVDSDNIEFAEFKIEDVDVSAIDNVISWLPTNGVFDLNLAEEGLILTLGALNFSQDKILFLEKWIGYLESKKNKAWSVAALEKADAAGHKAIKLREWFAQSDDDYISACNELTRAKALKRWFDNKADYFSSWHYAFKTFLKRDYSIEKMSNIGYNTDTGSFQPDRRSRSRSSEFGGEYEWEDGESSSDDSE